MCVKRVRIFTENVPVVLMHIQLFEIDEYLITTYVCKQHFC